MLTRLKVSGFKNLVDVDVRFGPFTCIAGANGVGKSNLFDAIKFLGALADKPLIDAALSVRDEGGRTTDVRSLFHRIGDEYDQEMSFEIEMIVPKTGFDDLGQEAEASITFLRYSLILAARLDESVRSVSSLEIVKEELVHINLGDALKHLLFHPSLAWRATALDGRRSAPLISTETDGAVRIIKLHQDVGNSERPLARRSSGRPRSLLAGNLPRTVLSSTNAAESPTALLARREMQSWRLLQLEPSSLREPDKFTAPSRLGLDGSHLAATLYQLARPSGANGTNGSILSYHEPAIYTRIANRLSELIEDVSKVSVERDDRRELLTLLVTDRGGTAHPARSLSDGTLRFLALAVLELEPAAQGLLCLEEPENGIHPERIPAILRLLQDIATDIDEPVGPDNPLRQVIINTHSPSIVSHVLDDSLLVAELKEALRAGQRFKRVTFSSLPDTWRQDDADGGFPVARGTLMGYLDPLSAGRSDMLDHKDHEGNERNSRQYKGRRVMDRPDLQPMLPFMVVKD